MRPKRGLRALVETLMQKEALQADEDRKKWDEQREAKEREEKESKAEKLREKEWLKSLVLSLPRAQPEVQRATTQGRFSGWSHEGTSARWELLITDKSTREQLKAYLKDKELTASEHPLPRGQTGPITGTVIDVSSLLYSFRDIFLIQESTGDGKYDFCLYIVWKTSDVERSFGLSGLGEGSRAWSHYANRLLEIQKPGSNSQLRDVLEKRIELAAVDEDEKHLCLEVMEIALSQLQQEAKRIAEVEIASLKMVLEELGKQEEIALRYPSPLMAIKDLQE